MVETVEVGGVRLAYQQAGSGQALVCVHGNFASRRWFSELLEASPAGWRAIALDLPNFGASAAMPEPISIAAYARYLAGFVAALGLKRPVLLGHSLGGAVVQAYAASCPDAAAALLLIASAPPGGMATPPEHYAALARFRSDREALAQALAATMPRRRPPYFAALVDDALAMQPAAFTDNARALEQHQVTASLAAVACPVLVLRGELDYLVSAEMAQATAAAFPNARLELWEGVGHSPQLEEPARFRQLVADFLAEIA